MPTYERLARFDRDYAALDAADKAAFRSAVQRFVSDLERGEGFRQGLRVKGIKSSPGLYETTWAADGRATFSYGAAVRGDDPHIVWHRVGRHEVLG